MTQPSIREAELWMQLHDAMDGNLSMSKRRKLIADYQATIFDAAAALAESENADCPPLTASPCQPCAARTAVAAKLRRMAEEARS
jgi:hypothetical protein